MCLSGYHQETDQAPRTVVCWRVKSVLRRDDFLQLRKCSSSKRLGSFEQYYPHEGSLVAWWAREHRFLWQLRCCRSSRCWCGWIGDAPTRGKSRGSGRMHDASHHRGGSERARRDELAWTNAANRRLRRTFCSGGGAGRNRMALDTKTRSTLEWSCLPNEDR
jgi:hypothetical protein